MKFFNLLIGASVCIVLSCGPAKFKVTQAQLDAFVDLVENKNFRIESDWAYPQVTAAVQQVLNSGLRPIGSTAGAINLIGNSNFLTISGDRVKSYLPYFGERQMNVDYGGKDNAIQFDGAIIDYKAEKVKGDSYRVTFKAKSKSESFDVFMKISPNLTSTMVLYGTSRRAIRYTGKVMALKEEYVLLKNVTSQPHQINKKCIKFKTKDIHGL